MMKSKLATTYPAIFFEEYNDKNIYIVDFTERTDSARDLEISKEIPSEPNKPAEKMDVLTLHNGGMLTLCFSMFDNHLFKKENGDDDIHCEGVFFPMNAKEGGWLSFLEIKDCKPKNISKYKKVFIEQIIHTAQLFRNNNIIDKQKVYGIISFPRRNKTAFNDFILGDDIARTQLLKEYRIIMLASNSINIIDYKKLEII